MLVTLRDFRAALLAALIVLGIVVQCSKARAAEAEVLTVAGGCFWCVEADFESVPGVIEVISGYTGGNTPNPTYKEVSRGGTGHFEAAQIHFDPARVSRERLLYLFFRSVDPTDAGGQFCDRGASYRTAIFVSHAGERRVAEAAKAAAERDLGLPVVTRILDMGPFHVAEANHQDYYKGRRIVLTRRGPMRQSSAYKFYRKSCGRDKRVRQLWGQAAAFAGH